MELRGKTIERERMVAEKDINLTKKKDIEDLSIVKHKETSRHD